MTFKRLTPYSYGMSILAFLIECDVLKQIPRVGWILHGVGPANAENVAAHSYSTTIVAYLLALLSDSEVDFERLLVIALLHDLPEAQLGDIPRSATKRLPKLQKAKEIAENTVMLAILESLPKEIRMHLLEAWNDFVHGASLEAQLVEAADRLATAIHVIHLVEAGHPKAAFLSFVKHAEKSVAALQIPAANDLVKELWNRLER